MPTLAAGGAFSPADICQLFLALAVLLGLARLLGEVAVWLKQPSVLGEILAGVLLGPTALGMVAPDWYTMLFPDSGPVGYSLEGIFIIAAALLLLIAGLEVELSSVWRQGKSALWVSVMSIVAPFAVGFVAAYFLPVGFGVSDDLAAEKGIVFPLFIGVALSITALPVIAKILMDLNLHKSDFGVVVISSAMVNDLLGWLGFALILAMMVPAGAEGGDAGGASSVAGTMLWTLVFLGLMVSVGKLVFNRVLPYLQAHTTWPGGVLAFVMVVAMLCAAYTEYIGIHSIFGAFIAGVAIGDSRHLRNQTRETIHQFISNFFSPLFFASIGLRVNFIDAFDPLAVVFVLVIAIVGKLLGSYLGAKWAGMSKREAWAVGFGMSARGAMEIILGKLALEAGLITQELFVALVVMALATSMLSGPAIERVLQRPKQRRLRDLLSEDRFVPRLLAANSRDAITVLSRRAAELTGLDPERIDEAVWQREQIMRTGLGHELAVPHARLVGLEKPLIVLALSPRGIDFDAPDGEPARIVALILTPDEDPGAQLEMLDVLARTFREPEVRSRAMAASSYTELLAALSGSNNHEAPHSENGG